VEEFTKESVIIAAGERQFELPNDYAFVMIGGESPDEFLQRAGIAIVEKTIAVSAFG
jgi:hypothetical protein